MKIVRLDNTAHEVSPHVSGRIHSKDGIRPEVWKLPEEAPASILYNGQSFAVMMVTPADLEDFAVGFSITEGIAASPNEIGSIRIAEAADGFLINIEVDAGALERAEGRRRTLTGRSGCGICGAQSLDAVMKPLAGVSGVWPDVAAIEKAFETMPSLQTMNLENRSTHAAAFCDLSGTVELVREDIGRHNALDKLAGALGAAGAGRLGRLHPDVEPLQRRACAESRRHPRAVHRQRLRAERAGFASGAGGGHGRCGEDARRIDDV